MPVMSASPAARTAPAGPAGPAIESVLESISVALAVLRPRMDAVSLAIHARPELKFAEFHARLRAQPHRGRGRGRGDRGRPRAARPPRHDRRHRHAR
ncbi:hypothetical protein FRAHR75_360029 [Frankia sp. Hr75.2]|nr:hypothetical protein FRAHR75_360029 [Frankia sp. Hr75.2]